MDQICNALGTGTILPNQMVCSIGTVEATTTILPDDIDKEQLFTGNYYRSVSVFPEQFVTFSFLWAGGGSLRWYRDTLGYHEKWREKSIESNRNNSYEVLIGEKIKPSKEIFLPYLSGTGPPFWDSLARGAFLGLNLASNEQNFVDAILEGVSYDLRYNLEQLQKAGINVEKICVVGGGSKSSKWLQIKSDIVKKPLLRLERQEGGSLGAALLAGYGVGLFDSLVEIAKHVNKIDKVFYPSGKYEKIYDTKYEIFKESYVKLKDINNKISAL
jgi:xylulokinase